MERIEHAGRLLVVPQEIVGAGRAAVGAWLDAQATEPAANAPAAHPTEDAPLTETDDDRADR